MAGAPRRPAWWFISGSTVHETTEHLDTLSFFDPDVVVNTVEETTKILDQLVAQEIEKSGIQPDEWMAVPPFRNPQRYDYWVEEAPKMVQRWLDWRKATNWKLWEVDGSPAIELKVEAVLAGKKVVGSIDRAFVLPNGDLAILDLKTGAKHDKEPLQLGLYAEALEQMGHPRPAYGYYWMAKKGEAVGPIPLEKYTSEFLSARFSQALDGMTKGIFLPNVSDNCDRCSVAASCFANDGENAWLFDSLAPKAAA